MAIPEKKISVARQVEHIISKLESLSTLSEVGVRVLSNLMNSRPDTAALTEIIESDAALSAQIFYVAYKQGIVFKNNTPSVAEAIAKLSPVILRQEVLSVGVIPPIDTGDSDVLPPKELALYALSTACCARDIAKLVLSPEDGQLAFSAGLMHVTGKMALAELMPKSFERMVREAKTQNSPLWQIEREHLGVDNTIIAKRLAEKWHPKNFPDGHQSGKKWPKLEKGSIYILTKTSLKN